MKKLPLLIVMIVTCCSFAWSQQIVTGKVTDANGAPLSGVSVTVKGGKRGTTTGPDGQFRISAPAGAVLIISNVGYLDKEVSAENASTNIILEQSSRSLQEVFVTGYGTQNKKQVTGSTSKISGLIRHSREKFQDCYLCHKVASRGLPLLSPFAGRDLSTAALILYILSMVCKSMPAILRPLIPETLNHSQF